MDHHIGIIKDRIIGIENDLKTYLDLRKNNRQHIQAEDGGDNLGGGNMVMAIALFAALGFLGKCYISVYANERGMLGDYFNDHGHADEQKIFVEFMLQVSEELQLFGETQPSKRALRNVWEFFRDFTTHLLAPDAGNSVVTFECKKTSDETVAELLQKMLDDREPVFAKNSDNKWVVNADLLLAWLPRLTEATTGYLSSHNATCAQNCEEILSGVLWR